MPHAAWGRSFQGLTWRGRAKWWRGVDKKKATRSLLPFHGFKMKRLRRVAVMSVVLKMKNIKVCLCCWGFKKKNLKRCLLYRFYQKKETFSKKKKTSCTFYSKIVFHNNIKLLLWQQICCNY